jgi:hypothetical protein
MLRKGGTAARLLGEFDIDYARACTVLPGAALLPRVEAEPEVPELQGR